MAKKRNKTPKNKKVNTSQKTSHPVPEDHGKGKEGMKFIINASLVLAGIVVAIIIGYAAYNQQDKIAEESQVRDDSIRIVQEGNVTHKGLNLVMGCFPLTEKKEYSLDLVMPAAEKHMVYEFGFQNSGSLSAERVEGRIFVDNPVTFEHLFPSEKVRHRFLTMAAESTTTGAEFELDLLNPDVYERIVCSMGLENLKSGDEFDMHVSLACKDKATERVTIHATVYFFNSSGEYEAYISRQYRDKNEYYRSKDFLQFLLKEERSEGGKIVKRNARKTFSVIKKENGEIELSECNR